MLLVSYMVDGDYQRGLLHSVIPVFFVNENGTLVSDAVAIVIDEDTGKFLKLFLNDITYEDEINKETI